MIEVKYLLNLFKKNNIDFFSGVPDSVLKNFSSTLENKDKKKHVIATNEGSAISIGIGYYLSTKKMPCIYMQNSGLSNAMNPIISIAHKNVYSIPMVLMIGWRGSPRIKDEPQHNVKGKITENLLKLLNIKYTILRTNKDLLKFNQQIKKAKKDNSIVACLIEQKTLKKKKSIKKKDFYNLDKEFFFRTLLEISSKKTKFFSSTGYNSRELMFIRDKYKLNKGNDFYMVGGMGHTTSVAFGYSILKKNIVICLDGDGSLLMHLGSIKTIASFAKNNFKYILLNNNSHDSVGGQNTFSDDINFKNFSKSLGFKNFSLIDSKKNLKQKIKNFLASKDLSFLEVKVSNSKINNLPRPKNLIKIKKEFMN
jgi:phosphonopyruvate decarboxylase